MRRCQHGTYLLAGIAIGIVLIAVCNCGSQPSPTGPEPRPPVTIDPPVAVEPPEPAGRPFADIEAEIIVRINELRATTGRCKARVLGTDRIVEALDVWGPAHPVESDSLLMEAADLYAQDLLAHGAGKPHIDSSGRGVGERIQSLEEEHFYYGVRFPMRWEGYGEVATIFHDPDRSSVAEHAVRNWKESPDGHCQAQWSSSYFYAGAAVAGRPEDDHWIAVVVFARPVGGGRF